VIKQINLTGMPEEERKAARRGELSCIMWRG
jgi:hypothetical protein